MNITKNQVDNLNLVVSLDIVNDDYSAPVGKILREYRQKASMPGFRPGHVPEGIIRKLYGKGVLVDEINKLVSESLKKYIIDEKLDIIGDPLPTVDGDEFDWEIGNDFHFDFEIGLTPAINVNLSKNDIITKYNITVDDALIERNVDNYTSRFGQFEAIDAVNDFTERLTGNICQLGSDFQPLEDGLAAEGSSFLLSLIKDEALKKPFEGAKSGDSIDFVLADTFTNKWEIASILRKRNADDVGDIKDVSFRFTVTTVSKFVKAELNQELFDKVFGEGTVNSEDEFKARIKSDIAANFEEAAMDRFSDDMHNYLLEKIAPPLPESFIRKWLWNINKDQMEESDFDKKFPTFLKEIRWSIISNTIVRDYDIQTTETEIIEQAKAITRKQFAQYGMINVPDENVSQYAMKYLEDEKDARGIVSQLLDQKVTQKVFNTVEVTVKDVTAEEFNALMEPKPDMPL